MRRYNGNMEELFRTIFRLRHICIKKEFDKKGIDHAGHPPILFVLKNESENMSASQKEIVDKLGISPPTVAISIKRMEKAGLLKKTIDKSDQRRNLIMLTEKGEQVVEESHAVLETVNNGMLKGFTQEECDQMEAYFIRIVSNLESMGLSPPEHLKSGYKK